MCIACAEWLEPFHQHFMHHHCYTGRPQCGPRRDGRPEPLRSSRRTPPGMTAFLRSRGRGTASQACPPRPPFPSARSVTGSGIRKSGNLAWSRRVLACPKGGGKWLLVTWTCAVGYRVGPLLGPLHAGVQKAPLNHGRVCFIVLKNTKTQSLF